MSEASDLFTRLAPVLNVRDLAAERTFYEKLGLPVIYEGPEYPDFIGFGTDTVHFGIQKASADNDPPSVLTWQIAVTDVDSAMERCQSAGISFELERNDPSARLDLPAAADPHPERLPTGPRGPQRIAAWEGLGLGLPHGG